MGHVLRTPMPKEAVQLMVAWVTARQPGTLDLAPRMILAPATMPSPLDRALRHGAPQVLATVPLPGVACPTTEISVISTMLQHQAETTPPPLRAPMVLLPRALLRQHLVGGPTMLPRLAEPSVRPRLEDCPSVEATMLRPLRPLTHQLPRLAALLLLPVRAMAMTTVVLATMRAHRARKCLLSFFLSYTVPTPKKIVDSTQHGFTSWHRLHICTLFTPRM